MIVAITGANGFIGKYLQSFLCTKGIEVRSISAIKKSTSVETIKENLFGVDVLINLAGTATASRWNYWYKKNLLQSRVLTTRKIVEAINSLDKKPELLISASSVRIYAKKGKHPENNFQMATDHYGKVCLAWEKEAQMTDSATRLAIIRLGLVLGNSGGSFPKMLSWFRSGFGWKIGFLPQNISWIHIYDVAQAILFIINNSNALGIYNLTAPNVSNNKKLTEKLSKFLRKRTLFTLPTVVVKFLVGTNDLLLAIGQHATPAHLLEDGYAFNYPTLREALDDIIPNEL